jgi:hypothetical protein
MPVSKIFGLSATGYGSGEDDLENYSHIVENQREKAEDVLDRIVPCVMMKVWGFIPEDWSLEWEPTRTLTAEQLEAVKYSKFQRTLQLSQAGLLTPQECMQYLQDEEIYTGQSEVLKGAEPTPLMGMMGEESMDSPDESKSSSAKASKEKTAQG